MRSASTTRSGKKHTVIESLDSRKLVIVRVHEIGELGHKFSALGTRHVKTPGGVQRLACSLDGAIDVCGCSLRDLGDRLAVGGVDDTRIALIGVLSSMKTSWAYSRVEPLALSAHSLSMKIPVGNSTLPLKASPVN